MNRLSILFFLFFCGCSAQFGIAPITSQVKADDVNSAFSRAGEAIKALSEQFIAMDGRLKKLEIKKDEIKK